MLDINNIWERIIKHEGEQFTTVRNISFTYTISGDYVRTSNTEYRIYRTQFEKAIPYMQIIKGPGEISKIVFGYSYVYAILNDPRIKY